jgi:hypothetical protein
MPDRERVRLADLDSSPQREFWYSVLTLFPFSFFPLVTIVAVLAGLILPYLNGTLER